MGRGLISVNNVNKTLQVKRAGGALFLLALWLPACTASATDVPFEAEIAHQETSLAQAASGSANPQPQQVVVSSGADLQPLPPIILGRAEFHASDPAAVQLNSGHVQLVEFFAYWCAVCKAMAPSIHGLENLYSDQVSFVYLDRDDPATFPLQSQLGYIYQPHFFLLDASGAILAQWRGYVDPTVIQRALVEALSH